MQVLRHWPHTVDHPFQSDYEDLPRRESDEDFIAWQEGRTGYPIVDAGMRQLAQTGYMHNRVRMIVASFLCKHLLIHRKRGERHFARELFDYELSSNVGNRQRAASTGVDAVPYFRIFNPWTQQSKFDPDYEYIRRRIPDFDPDHYIDPIVDHQTARERAISVFKATRDTVL
jgi:deoxyribodipyrimidine photo-lyase